MAQGDYLIQNQSFPSFRSDLNSTLEAINTSNSGTSRPTSAVAGTVWLDVTNATNPTLKFFDGTDDISLAQFDYSANTVNWLDSTVVADFNLVDDTTPQLGGNLDVNGNSIVSVSNGNITFTPDGTGKVIIDGLSHPTADGTAGQFMKTDGAGNLSFDTVDLTNLSASNLTSGTVPIDRLGTSGTKDATTFLRGDNTFTEVPAGGITEADMFRLTASLTSNANPISSNLERVDDATFSKIGTGMSLSSGIYTFPTTGLYYIIYNFMMTWSSSDSTSVDLFISSDSGSNYDNVAHVDSAGTDNHQSSNHAFVNVTDASTFRAKFATSSMTSSSLTGNTDQNYTTFTFIRLGDSQ